MVTLPLSRDCLRWVTALWSMPTSWLNSALRTKSSVVRSSTRFRSPFDSWQKSKQSSVFVWWLRLSAQVSIKCIKDLGSTLVKMARWSFLTTFEVSNIFWACSVIIKNWLKPLTQRCPTKIILPPHLPLLWQQSLCCHHNWEKYAAKYQFIRLFQYKTASRKTSCHHNTGLLPQVANGDRVGQRCFNQTTMPS